MTWRIRTLTLALLLGAACRPTPDSTCDTATLPAASDDRVVVVEPWAVYTCPDFPANDQGLGTPCDSHSDCPDAAEICVWGVVPCERDQGRCTLPCRMDRECHKASIDFDTQPPLVCTITDDQLSICLPSACQPRVEGWDTTCGPLAGEPVNDTGLGKRCHGDADCAGLVASVCPSPDAPEPHCTMPCETDVDCGPGGACVCVDNPECTEEFFVCAPAIDCAEAVRHHHCRGEGIPPRDHEMPCGGHGR